MIARRLVLSLALIALGSNLVVFARPKPGVGARSDGQAFSLMSIKHEVDGALTRVLVESNAPPLYTVFRPTDRLVIVDLPGGEGSKLAAEYPVKSALVDSILVRRSKTGGGGGRAITRLEISVRGAVRDRSRVSGSTLILEFAPGQAEAKSARPEVKPPAPAQETSRPGVTIKPVPVGARTPASADRVPAQPKSLKPATVISSVRHETFEGGVRILVETNGAAEFKDFVLANPWRIIVDIKGVHSAVGNKTFPVAGALVERVRVGQPSADVVRVVLDTKSKVPYRITRDGASLVISVGDAPPSHSKIEAPVKDKSQASDNVQASDKAPADQKSRTAAKLPQPAATVAPAKPEPSDPSPREVKVAGQRIDDPSGRKQDVPSNVIAQGAKPTAGSQAKPGQTPRVSAQPNRSLPPSTSPKSSSRETIVQPASPPADNRSVLDVQRPTPAAATSPAASNATPPPVQGQKPRSELAFCDPGYEGGLISFDLRAGVDLRDMLRFVSQQYGINFIFDKSVTQVPVDIRVNDIPWNQVLESVMRANRLGAVCESNGRIIRIATLAAVKEEQEQQRALKEEVAKQKPLTTKVIHLKYARAAGSLGATGSGSSGRGSSSSGGSVAGAGGAGGGMTGQGTLLGIIQTRLSPRGRIEMEARSNTLIITDLPEYVQNIDNIIAQLDKPEPQVEIEARIVIASRNFLRDIGNELAGGLGSTRRNGQTGLLQTSPAQFSPGGLTPGGAQGGAAGGGTGGSTTPSLGPNLLGPFASPSLRAGVANTVLSLTTGAVGTGILSLALSASETKGQIRTIASPRVTATDNKTAEIVNGVQIPVQTVSNNTITTTFVTAALRLEITPQIVEETGEVLMHIVAENNTVNFALANQFNNGTPGINTQSAESIVRIQDGGTTVMGGINLDSESHTMNRTPGISRLPLIGELFKRRTTRRDFDEILFFVTPRIVRSDGSVGPRSLTPQRSSNEAGAPNPQTATPVEAGVQKPAQPNVQANAAATPKGNQ